MLLPACLLWLLLANWLLRAQPARPLIKPPVSIDARLVILPPSPASPSVSPKIPSHQTPLPLPPEKTVITPRVMTTPAPTPSIPPVPVTPLVNTSQNPPSPPPAPSMPVTTSTDTTVASGGTGARAIYQPKPDIPDELRDQVSHTTVLARFHISASGAVTVELVKAAADPRLNQLVLNTLRDWRFFPATKNGNPVDSTQDITIHLNVDN